MLSLAAARQGADTAAWVTWVFSGLGVAVPLALLGWLASWLARKRQSAGKPGVRQWIRSGDGSVNVQVGNDLTLGERVVRPTMDEGK